MESIYIRRDLQARESLLRRARFAAMMPLLVFLAYYAATILIFSFGPISYPLFNKQKTLWFLMAAYGTFAAGYLLYRPRTGSDLAKMGDPSKEMPYTKQWYRVFLVASVLSILLNLIIFVQVGSIGGILSRLINPGKGYYATRGLLEDGAQASLLVRLLSIGTAFLACSHRISFVLGCMFWKRLGKGARVLYVAVVLLQILANQISGRQITYAAMLFLLLPLLLYHAFARSRVVSDKQLSLPRRILRKMRAQFRMILIITIVLLMLLVLISFVFLSTRTSSLDTGRVLQVSDPSLTYNDRWWGERYLPSQANYAVTLLMYYISHGYAGLDACMSLPFVPCYGLGSSRALNTYMNKYLGTPDMTEKTYPVRSQMVTGRDALVLWVTAFPWIASDITFLGAILLMFFVGCLVKSVWRRCLVEKSPAGFLLMGQLCVGLFMIVANNQLFHTLEDLLTTMTLMFIFWMTLLPSSDRIPAGRHFRSET